MGYVRFSTTSISGSLYMSSFVQAFAPNFLQNFGTLLYRISALYNVNHAILFKNGGHIGTQGYHSTAYQTNLDRFQITQTVLPFQLLKIIQLIRFPSCSGMRLLDCPYAAKCLENPALKLPTLYFVQLLPLSNHRGPACPFQQL